MQSIQLNYNKFYQVHTTESLDKNKKISIVVYRPHTGIGWFKKSILNIVKKQNIPTKYAALFDYFYNSNSELYLTTSLTKKEGIKGLIKSLIEPIELILWCILNNINLKRVKLIFDIDEMAKKDVLFIMHYENFTHEINRIALGCITLASKLSTLSIYKVVHMTHYMYNPSIGAENLEKFQPDLLVAENDLVVNSAFYKKYFSHLTSNFYQMAYTPASRFIRRTPFKERVNKLVATGSITYKMKDPEFLEFFGVNELQPLRRILYENAYKFPAELDCQISDLNLSRSAELRRSKILFGAQLWNKYVAKHPQFDYYKTDIVTTYNSYKMFTVPEEVCSLPAIGFIEGMACGCAFFGLDDPMYRDLGLLPNIHYVSYDGSISDLMEKIRFYQINSAALEEIANRGFEFAQNHMTPEVVYAKFMDKLRTDLAKYKLTP